MYTSYYLYHFAYQKSAIIVPAVIQMQLDPSAAAAAPTPLALSGTPAGACESKASVFLCVCVLLCACVRVCAFVPVCIYIYIYACVQRIARMRTCSLQWCSLTC
jgi:hypothetical protein